MDSLWSKFDAMQIFPFIVHSRKGNPSLYFYLDTVVHESGREHSNQFPVQSPPYPLIVAGPDNEIMHRLFSFHLVASWTV